MGVRDPLTLAFTFYVIYINASDQAKAIENAEAYIRGIYDGSALRSKTEGADEEEGQGG